MSTDFCVETLLHGSTSSTSVTSSGSHKDLHLSLSPPDSNRSKGQVQISPSQPKIKPHTSPAQYQHTPSFMQQSSVLLQPPSEQPEKAQKKGTKRKLSEVEDSSSSGKKEKRVRTVYSPAQTQQLETIFRQTPYPDLLMREKIAEEMGFEERKIHVWFQNRRAKQRKTTGHPTIAPAAVYNPHLYPAVLTSQPAARIPSPATVPQSSPGLPLHYPPPQHSVATITASLPGARSMTSALPTRASTVGHSLPVYLPLRSPSPPLTTAASYQQQQLTARSSLSPQPALPLQYRQSPSPPVTWPTQQVHPSQSTERYSPVTTAYLLKRSPPPTCTTSQTAPILSSYLRMPTTPRFTSSLSQNIAYGQARQGIVAVPHNARFSNNVNNVCYGFVNY